MNIKTISLCLVIAILTCTCKEVDPNKQIDEGTIKNSLYTNDELGWEMEIPKGWDIVTLEETNASNELGLNAMEDALDGDIDMSQLKNLLSFNKNKFNLFSSSSEPFEVEYEGEWEETNEALKDMISEVYQSQGIKSTASDITEETIDDLVFTVYEIKIYGPNNSVILNQLAYSRLLNGYDFAVNINYNNDADKKDMLTAFRNSKFRKAK